MYPPTHFLLPFFIGGTLTILGYYSWEYAILAGITGVLVDADHLIEHALKAKKDRWNFKKTWNQAIIGHRWRERSFIHDTSGELLMTALFLILATLNALVTSALALGYYTHIVLDDIHYKKETYYRTTLFGYKLKEGYHELLLNTLLIIASTALLLWV